MIKRRGLGGERRGIRGIQVKDDVTCRYRKRTKDNKEKRRDGKIEKITVEGEEEEEEEDQQ